MEIDTAYQHHWDALLRIIQRTLHYLTPVFSKNNFYVEQTINLFNQIGFIESDEWIVLMDYKASSSNVIRLNILLIWQSLKNCIKLKILLIAFVEYLSYG